MSADLAARIRAELDLWESLANAATPGPWEAVDRGHSIKIRSDVEPYNTVANWDQTELPRDLHWLSDSPDVQFIAANDPSSVLRQVEGLRQILRLHEADNGVCSTCVDVDAWSGMTDSPDSLPLIDYPCPTLRSVAFMLGVTPDEKEQQDG